MSNEVVTFEAAPAGTLGPHRAAVSHRGGGVSAGPFRSLNLGRSVPDSPDDVAVNERRLLAELGLPDRVARLRLEHGARILAVTEPGMYGPADALVTDREDLVLWFTVADCYPLTITAGSWRGHAHCGWRGTAAGLAEALCRELTAQADLPASEFRAWIGPGIGPCCYPVGPEVVAAFPPESMRRLEGDARPRLDLGDDLARRLRASGLTGERIARSHACTACHPERFFSHRRDGSPSGRMAALCWFHGFARASEPRSSR